MLPNTMVDYIILGESRPGQSFNCVDLKSALKKSACLCTSLSINDKRCLSIDTLSIQILTLDGF